MKLPDFELERWKASRVLHAEFDLSETGIPPLPLREIFMEELLDLPLDYGTTEGTERLREEISELYLNVEKEEVLVTHGASEGNFIGSNIVINGGDEVIAVTPTFMQTPGILEAIGARIKYLRLREEDQFALDVNQLNELTNPKTRAIALSYPNNPTGTVLSKGQVKAISEIAEDRNAWILADEVYRGLEFEGEFSPSFADHYEKAVVTSSLSKVFGLAGLRLGWMIGPREVVQRGWAFREYTSLAGSSLSEKLAEIALEKGNREKLIERGRRLARHNFSIFDGWMQHHSDIFSWIKPRFGVIALIKHALRISSFNFSEMLFKEKRITVVPGEVFGLNSYLRLSYCLEESRLTQALRLLDDFLDGHLPEMR